MAFTQVISEQKYIPIYYLIVIVMYIVCQMCLGGAITLRNSVFGQEMHCFIYMYCTYFIFSANWWTLSSYLPLYSLRSQFLHYPLFKIYEANFSFAGGSRLALLSKIIAFQLKLRTQFFHAHHCAQVKNYFKRCSLYSRFSLQYCPRSPGFPPTPRHSPSLLVLSRCLSRKRENHYRNVDSFEFSNDLSPLSPYLPILRIHFPFHLVLHSGCLCYKGKRVVKEEIARNKVSPTTEEDIQVLSRTLWRSLLLRLQ